MTEAEAQAWTRSRFSDRCDLIARFLGMVEAENAKQNLIAASTLPQKWARHGVDSLQLVEYAPTTGAWYDIGTGGGFPGMMVAIVRPEPIFLIEPRRKRAEFLAASAAQLGLLNVNVIHGRAETVEGDASVITARAVTDTASLLRVGKPWCSSTTRWILPRGSHNDDDERLLTSRFGTTFHVEHSITSSSSVILLATGTPQ